MHGFSSKVIQGYRNLLITAGLLCTFSVQAQDGVAVADMYLQGTWMVECPIEVLDHASIRLCGLCKTSDSQAHAVWGDFKMTFQHKTIIMHYEDGDVSIPYSRDKDNHSIKFTLDAKPHHYRLMILGEKRFLVSMDGMKLMILERPGDKS